MKLTNNEVAVFKLLVNASFDNGGDFGFTDEVNYESIGMSPRSYSGVVGSLAKKGFVAVETGGKGSDAQFNGQYQFTETSVRLFEMLGLDPEKHDHLIQYIN